MFGGLVGRATSAFLILRREDPQKVPEPRGRKQQESQAPGWGWPSGEQPLPRLLRPQGPDRGAGRRAGCSQGPTAPAWELHARPVSSVEARALSLPGPQVFKGAANRPEPGGWGPRERLQSWEEEARDPVGGFPRRRGPRLLARGREGGSVVWGPSTEARKEETTAQPAAWAPPEGSLGRAEATTTTAGSAGCPGLSSS